MNPFIYHELTELAALLEEILKVLKEILKVLKEMKEVKTNGLGNP